MTAQSDTSREAKSIWLKTSLFTPFWEKGGGGGGQAGGWLSSSSKNTGRMPSNGRGGAGGA